MHIPPDGIDIQTIQIQYENVTRKFSLFYIFQAIKLELLHLKVLLKILEN